MLVVKRKESAVTPEEKDRERIRRLAAETWARLDRAAQEVFGQLYLNGPQWDGYVVSKTGRDALHALGLIERGFGWQWLTREGVEVAVHAPVGDFRNGVWRRKQIAA